MAGWCVLKANRDTMLVNQNKSNVKQDNAVPVSVTMAGSIVATTDTILCIYLSHEYITRIWLCNVYERWSSNSHHIWD